MSELLLLLGVGGVLWIGAAFVVWTLLYAQGERDRQAVVARDRLS